MATELFVDPDPMQALKDMLLSQKIETLDLIKVDDKAKTNQ